MPEHLILDTFKEKIYDWEASPNKWEYKGSLPAIIDFYADWCGPCKMVAPLLEELSNDYQGKLLIYKINTDEQQELAGIFGIQSIPSLLFIPMDKDPQMAKGALPKNAFVEIIEKELLPKEG